MHMAVQHNVFTAKSLLELVNRGISGRVDTFEVITPATARDSPLDDPPLTRFADPILAQVSVRTGAD